MIYPGKFGGIPSIGSRGIVDTRFCHVNADTDTDSNGIHTDTNMSPSPLMGGGGGGGGGWGQVVKLLLNKSDFGRGNLCLEYCKYGFILTAKYHCHIQVNLAQVTMSKFFSLTIF